MIPEKKAFVVVVEPEGRELTGDRGQFWQNLCE